MRFDLGGILWLIGIIVVIVGIFFFYRWRKGEGFSLNIASWFSSNGKTQHNCFNIYRDSVCFETMDEVHCKGIPWKFQNDGKYYYIHEEHDGNLEKFTLPDVDSNNIHYDPIEVRNVITMPRNKAYMNWSSSMFQKIAIGIMAFIVLGEFIMLVILSGGNTSG